jgi:hypothetical protein
MLSGTTTPRPAPLTEERKIMNAARLRPIALAAAALVNGCAAPSDPASIDTGEAVAAATTSAPRGEGPALRLEQAERSLDVGRDLTGARASLATLVADPTLTPEQRDEARLSLSRAVEAGGDHEAAISAVEALLAEHPDGTRFPLEEAAEGRLRKLLTGSDAEPRRRAEDGRPVAPFARALARYFPAPNTGHTTLELRLLAFGGSSEQSDRLGTFAVDRAVRDQRRQACPLCDDRLSIHTASGRSGSWVGVARSRAELPSALAIFYFDLGAGRIPARYDAELPLPSADIAARLSRGDGLIAVRERPGAPPVVLIAAPRDAQLADVEEVLAAMKTIPSEPVVVPLKADLRSEEIQAVVRGSFGAYRSCYEAVLTRIPTAAGTAKMHFTIRADGSVDGVSMEPTDGALHDATFEACMTTATSALVFPATTASGHTTVTYPVVFTPGP